MVNIIERLEEWQRLDDAALFVEGRIEQALDRYCEGTGAAPSPPLVAFSKHLRGLACKELRGIWHELEHARSTVKQI